MFSELAVKGAKPSEKSYMIRDDHLGNKKEHKLSLGPYPDLSLKDARIKRDEIQTARAKGESPSRKTVQAPQLFNVCMKDKAESYVKTIIFRLNKYILPALGDWPLKEITSGNILQICRRIENTGHYETAKRVKAVIGQIYRFAISAGYTDTDPTSALLGALKPRRNKHYATIKNPAEISILMKAIKAYPYTVMRCAMLFSVYTAARTGEIRRAEWSEIHEDTWDIPPEKMKMKRRNIVPLSLQVKSILNELRPITGKSRWLFPSPRDNLHCMSENGVRVALRTISYTNKQITLHGFRVDNSQ